MTFEQFLWCMLYTKFPEELQNHLVYRSVYARPFIVFVLLIIILRSSFMCTTFYYTDDIFWIIYDNIFIHSWWRYQNYQFLLLLAAICLPLEENKQKCTDKQCKLEVHFRQESVHSLVFIFICLFIFIQLEKEVSLTGFLFVCLLLSAIGNYNLSY
jgi:hypothetical protein